MAAGPGAGPGNPGVDGGGDATAAAGAGERAASVLRDLVAGDGAGPGVGRVDASEGWATGRGGSTGGDGRSAEGAAGAFVLALSVTVAGAATLSDFPAGTAVNVRSE